MAILQFARRKGANVTRIDITPELFILGDRRRENRTG